MEKINLVLLFFKKQVDRIEKRKLVFFFFQEKLAVTE